MDGVDLDGDILDVETFEQILVCDEDDEKREFSREIVTKYFSQAEETLPMLRKLFDSRSMSDLSKKGHFLKSSSAVLGVKKVRESCELIQNYGNLKDFKNNKTLTEDEAAKLLEQVLARLDGEYAEVKKYLQKLYKMSTK